MVDNIFSICFEVDYDRFVWQNNKYKIIFTKIRLK